MKRRNFIKTSVSVLLTTMVCGCSHGNSTHGKTAAAPAAGITGTGEPATVYFTKEISPESLLRMYRALGREAHGRVGVKLSMGEPGGHHFLQPGLVAPLVREVGGTFIDANTAYGGNRATTELHLKAAEDHGFTAIAPVDILDADGEIRLPVNGGRHLAYDIVGSRFPDYDFTLVLSHFKGHMMGGFGGALKIYPSVSLRRREKLISIRPGRARRIGATRRRMISSNRWLKRRRPSPAIAATILFISA